MVVYFEMISNGIKQSYQAMGKKKGNVISFPDKLSPQTLMEITINENEVIIRRKGKIDMIQGFRYGQAIQGTYQSIDGLSLNIKSITRELRIEGNLIQIIYDYYIEKDFQATNKLTIKY